MASSSATFSKRSMTMIRFYMLALKGAGYLELRLGRYQPALERYVAIKVIHEQLVADDETFLKRFRREAKAVAALRHPNIVQVLDFGTQDGVWYMVMEYLEGTTLKVELKALAKRGETMSLKAVQYQ